MSQVITYRVTGEDTMLTSDFYTLMHTPQTCIHTPIVFKLSLSFWIRYKTLWLLLYPFGFQLFYSNNRMI